MEDRMMNESVQAANNRDRMLNMKRPVNRDWDVGFGRKAHRFNNPPRRFEQWGSGGRNQGFGNRANNFQTYNQKPRNAQYRQGNGGQFGSGGQNGPGRPTGNNNGSNWTNSRGNASGRPPNNGAPARNGRRNGTIQRQQYGSNYYQPKTRWYDGRHRDEGGVANKRPSPASKNWECRKSESSEDDGRALASGDVSLIPHTLLTNSGVPQGIDYHYFFHTLPMLLAYTRLHDDDDTPEVTRSSSSTDTEPTVALQVSEESNSSMADSGYHSESGSTPCTDKKVKGTDGQLSVQITQLASRLYQSNDLFNQKMHLRDFLYYNCSQLFPMCGLYVVGSSLNGFGNNDSDIDLCLMITNKDLDQRTDAVEVLTLLRKHIDMRVEMIEDQQLIVAKVPILRIKFCQPFQNIVVDVNANNSVAIRNTHLLFYYSTFDPRVRPLVLSVKEWAKQQGINDAVHATLSSYSLVLMTIHYLQCGAKPPVLPSLQVLYPEKFNHPDVRTLNSSERLQPHPESVWSAKNEQKVGQLMLGFMRYFASEFDFEEYAMSVRLGKKLKRDRADLPPALVAQWRCLCIEEPFTRTNTAHSVYDTLIFARVKQAFTRASVSLEKDGDLRSLMANG